MTKSVSPTNIEENKNLDVNTEESSTLENQDVNSENSSDSGKSEPVKSTLDVVKEALNVDKEGDDEVSDVKTEDVKSDKKDDTLNKESEFEEIPEDEKNLMKVKTRKRIEQLQYKFREEKDLRVKVEKERNEYKNDADNFKQFRDFLAENTISTEEANQLFNIGALMKRDPIEALKAMTPYYNSLLEVTGHVLSPDLEEQVKLGYITEKAARELSVQRASNVNYRNREQYNQHRQQQNEEVHSQKQQILGIQSAIANLEKNWESSDPDYKQKSTRVNERIKLKLFEAKQKGSLPNTPDEAVKLAETVKKEVDKEMATFFVRKKPIKSIDGGNAGGSIKPMPKTTLDVIRQTVSG